VLDLFAICHLPYPSNSTRDKFTTILKGSGRHLEIEVTVEKKGSAQKTSGDFEFTVELFELLDEVTAELRDEMIRELKERDE
jgi:hypothetical protein